MLSRRTVLFAALFLGACGGELKSSTTGSTGSSSTIADRPNVGVSIKAMTGVTSTAGTIKTVLQRTEMQNVQVFQGGCSGLEGDVCLPATCPCDTGDVCVSGYCYKPTPVNRLFAVANQTGSAGTVAVPCDGLLYTITAFASSANAAPFQITDWRETQPFQMPTAANCSAANIPTVTWDAPVAYPSYTIPTIYAGMTSQKYVVGVQDLAYPWSGTWQQTAPAGGAQGGTSVTYPSPATSDPITFTATFHLDHSLLLTDEDWTWDLTQTADPVPFGTVTMP